MTTYRLGSSPMINSLGIVRWAINGYHFPRDRKNMVNVLAEGWKLPREAAAALLGEKVPYTIEGTDDMPVVVFTVGA